MHRSLFAIEPLTPQSKNWPRITMYTAQLFPSVSQLSKKKLPTHMSVVRHEIILNQPDKDSLAV